MNSFKYTISALLILIVGLEISLAQCGGLVAGNNGGGETFTMTGNCSITGTVTLRKQGGATNLIIPTGTSLVIDGFLDQASAGTITVQDGGTLTILNDGGGSGDLRLLGALVVQSGGTLNVDGDIDQNSGNNITLAGTVNITGDLNNTSNGTIDVTSTGDLTVFNLSNGQNGTVNLNGSVNINGSFDNLGNGAVGASGSVSIAGDFNNTGNNGDVTVSGGFNVGGTFTNEGGDITVEDGAVLKAETLELNGNGGVTVDNGGTFASDNPIGGTGTGTVTSPSGDTTCDNGCCGAQCNTDGTALNNGGSEILPVSLLYFEARTANNIVNISWATASELNNDRFLLELSYDAEHFELISTVEGSGTINNQVDYSFQHQPFSEGLIFYRLTQVDFDGTSELLGILAVQYEPLNSNNKRVYPIPVESSSTLFIDNFKGLIYSVDLYLVDLAGRKRTFENMTNANNQLALEIPNVPEGIYFVTGFINGLEFKRRVIVK